MRNYIPPLLLIILLGTGCATTPQTTDDTATQAPETETNESDDGVPVIDILLDGDQTTPLVVTDSEGTQAEVGIEVVAEPVEEAVNVSMETGNYFFAPDSIIASAGQRVNVTFSANTGFHTFVIDEIELNETVTEGETISFTAPDQPGTYAFYCDVGSHRAFGMEGTLEVK